MRLPTPALTATLLFTAVCALAGTLPIDDFSTIQAWSVNQDGGAIDIAADTLDDKRCMRLTFRREARDWGNAARAVSLPRNATGVEFDVFVRATVSPAGLYVWLMEPDGDAYMAPVRLGVGLLHEVRSGWHHCYVPVSTLKYEPRGNGKRELLSASKMLIGISHAIADVCIAGLAFRTFDEGTRMLQDGTNRVRIKSGANGRVAVLNDAFPARPGSADPDTLAEALTAHGYGVTMLDSVALSDPSLLTRANFDCLVLPYGPSYPVSAYHSIKAYLKSGGCFLSMGGYAFDEPCVAGALSEMAPVGDTVTAADVAAGETAARRLNTRFGAPADTMGLQPDQIGVFDPAYHLKFVTGLRSAPGQYVLPAGVTSDVKAEGYAACSMLGSNNPVFPDKWGRHIPLLDSHDSFGRSRGSAGSMAHNYAGPYAGSSWAFFGVTNADLFAKDGPMLPCIGAVVDALVARTFLHSLATDFACYKDGETVRISCKLADLGKRDHAAEVTFRVLDRTRQQVFASEAVRLELKAGKTETARAELELKKPLSDLYRVVADLSVDGKPADSMETGFAVYDPKTAAGGLDLNFRENYFRDGDRPVLFSGVNQTGAIFHSGNENPLVWDRDLARMNENGLNIMRVLHFSPFMSDSPTPTSVKPIDLKLDRMPLATERKLDALVQLCQKHKIVLFLSIHDWMDVALTGDELAAQKHFAKLIAARYKDAPGFMIDIQNEPHIELPRDPAKQQPAHVTALWNDYLRAQYGTDDALRAAWEKSPPEAALGSVPYLAGSDAWDDVRTRDADAFRNVLLNRWAEANYEGAKEGNPDMPVTVGFLQEYWSLNKLACVDGLDFANMHSYNTIDTLRGDLKLFDRRFQGKSISLGEFGALPDHEKRAHGEDNPGQDYLRYLLTGHYLFGEGGSFMANWCWKDMSDVIFPWGINYACNGPAKDILKAYRNQSLLMRQIRPVYKPQEVFLVVPLDQMLGGKARDSIVQLYRWVDVLLTCRLDFGVIDDQHLDLLPSSARLLVYPMANGIPDAAYDRIKVFVERGGTLCITGDPALDSARKRTHVDRVKELCGTDAPAETTHTLGNGIVYYSQSQPGGSPVLDEVLKSAPAGARIGAQTTGSVRSHVFRLFETNGGRTLLFANPADEPCSWTVGEPGTKGWSLTIGGSRTGLIRYNKKGELGAIEFQNEARIGNTVLLADGHWAIISCDGKDIRNSRELILLPFGEGHIDLRPLAGAKGCVVQRGDLVDGRWRVLSETSSATISASGATAFDIRIIAPRDRLPALAQHVVSELMLSGSTR